MHLVVLMIGHHAEERSTASVVVDPTKRMRAEEIYTLQPPFNSGIQAKELRRGGPRLLHSAS
jgi:hypothetical protein